MTSQLDVTDLARLLKVIADETRLRILGALAGRPMTGKDLAEHLDLAAPTISHHMKKLTEAGVVVMETEAQRHWYRLNGELLLASKRVPLTAPAVATSLVGDAEMDEDERFRAKVIRDFFDGGRLKEIPAQRKRRVIVLQHILARFEPGRTYTEREVNEIIRPVHEDVATLRRELVDYGYMLRDRGIYQMARAAPERTRQIAQEITGDEGSWLASLLQVAIDANGANADQT
ncbi:MAG: metalloregulator ArsR/SmtB family transcription factor [Thermomicrobiales bacterium]